MLKPYKRICKICKRKFFSKRAATSFCRGCVKKRTYPIEFNHVKVLVYKRDSNMCVCCLRSVGVGVHHINEDKKDNRLDNLVCLCIQCHMSLHGFLRTRRKKLHTLDELISILPAVNYEDMGIRLNWNKKRSIKDRIFIKALFLYKAMLFKLRI